MSQQLQHVLHPFQSLPIQLPLFFSESVAMMLEAGNRVP